MMDRACRSAQWRVWCNGPYFRTYALIGTIEFAGIVLHATSFDGGRDVQRVHQARLPDRTCANLPSLSSHTTHTECFSDCRR
jgi:hypothetical protein